MAHVTEHEPGLIMPRRLPLSAARVMERLARRLTPRHRELVRGMVSEIDSIDEPTERRRFALGAVAAVVRLTLSGIRGDTVHAPSRFVDVAGSQADANYTGISMSNLTMRQLLRRHAPPFTISFAVLTVLLVANFAARRVPELSARGEPLATIAQLFMLAVPFVVAMTLPMAVFVATLWVFARLGAEGVIADALRGLHGVRRLLRPVLSLAVGVGALALVMNTQVLPRANARLASVLAGTPRALSDRTMTVGELRGAARSARADPGPAARARAATYEVEIQKKFALSAACIVLALAGAAIGLRFPRGGMALVIGASIVVFTGYYLSMISGEALADRQVISPLVAMWASNALLLVLVSFLVRGSDRTRSAGSAGSLAIGG